MGQSQVLQVLDASGFLVTSDSLNRGGAPNSNLLLSNLPAGVYQFVATLYSGSNASGSVVGESRSVVDLCAGGAGGTTVQRATAANVDPQTVVISPNSLKLVEQQTSTVIASAMRGTAYVFIDPAALTLQVSGGVGTIAGQTFTATVKGSGSILAKLSSPKLSATAPVTITERIVTQGKWTVLVYMNAANDLHTFSELNMNQMEQVAGNSDVRFVVQWKQSKAFDPSSSFDGVKRYLVKSDTDPNVIRSEIVQDNLRELSGPHAGQALDMGNPQTLADFVAWGKANFPADRYVLILWNHGNGWLRSPTDDASTRGFSYDDQYSTSIQTWELSTALAGQHFDILSWDSSLMQMLEVAYEARGIADLVAGSEESPPGEGLPYHLVFKKFRDTPDATTAALSKGFVDGMLGFSPYVSRKITQSVLDTTKLSALAVATDDLATKMVANAGALSGVIPDVRASAQSYSPNFSGTRNYRDLYDVCLKLEADSRTPSVVKTSAANVRSKITAAIVHEGHNGNSANSHGISIDFSTGSVYAGFASDYQQLKFAQDTSWDSFLNQAP